MSKESQQQASYSFSLTGVSLLEKSLGIISTDQINSKEFDYDISLRIGHTPQEKKCVLEMHVSITASDNAEVNGRIGLRCTFDIEGFDDYVQGSTSVQANPFPQDLVYLLNSVIIGTMRGVMFSEFRGTYLEKAYLPVLDPRQFKKADD